ncbi:MAG: DUF3552 domain-containing protein, partial [Bacteroidales bacterium]|nr:DUF3552 domain-containing protein [Bacteroidales bacterium]
MLIPIIVIVSAAAGIGIYILIRNVVLRKKGSEIIRTAELEGENIKKEKIFQAKEKFLQLKSEHEAFINEKNNQLHQLETKVKQKEMSIGQQSNELARKIKENDQIKENLKNQLELLNKKKEEYEQLHNEAIHKIEEVAGMTAQAA